MLTPTGGRVAARRGTMTAVRVGIARDRGWEVHLFDGRDVEVRAAALLGGRAEAVLQGPRAALGPPWTKDHRTALAATVLAGA